jgi:hypothetical protein
MGTLKWWPRRATGLPPPSSSRAQRSRSQLFGAVVGAGAMWLAIGYGWIGGSIPRTFSYTKLPDIAGFAQFGCKAVASATLNEEVSLVEPPSKYRGKLKVLAEPGTDTLSMKIEGTKLLVMTGADVRVARMQPSEMAIIRNDKRALVAVQITDTADVYVVHMDWDSGNAIWGKVGEFMLGGAIGWVHYVECGR